MQKKFRKNKKLKIKDKDLLIKSPKTYLKCVLCGEIQVINGIVYGTDPVFVGMHRKCKKCGYHLFNRIEQIDSTKLKLEKIKE